MATINQVYQRVKALDTNQLINEAFDETLDELADINRDRMLDGVKANWVKMPDYSARSVTEFGKLPGPIRLYDTGEFQQAIKVTREGDVLITESLDSKNDLLVYNYGEEIFGTFGQYKQKYQDIDLRPVLHRKIENATGLKFK